MKEKSKYMVLNIREYLNGKNEGLREDDLLHILSENAEAFSNTVKKKIARVGKINEKSHTYSLAAYLIAQLGKNYFSGANENITGEELLGLAIKQIEQLQYLAGGMVVFLEATCEEHLVSFYLKNGFRRFDSRTSEKTDGESKELIQFLKILK